jgi:hypothetical protein
MSRIAVALGAALLVLWVPSAPRAQLREPSCPTFAGMSQAQRDVIVLGMLAGFVAATTLAQETAVERASHPGDASGARLVSERLTRTALNVQGLTARQVSAKLRDACALGKNLASPANLVLLELMIAAAPRERRPSAP